MKKAEARVMELSTKYEFEDLVPVHSIVTVQRIKRVTVKWADLSSPKAVSMADLKVRLSQVQRKNLQFKIKPRKVRGTNTATKCKHCGKTRKSFIEKETRTASSFFAILKAKKTGKTKFTEHEKSCQGPMAGGASGRRRRLLARLLRSETMFGNGQW